MNCSVPVLPGSDTGYTPVMLSGSDPRHDLSTFTYLGVELNLPKPLGNTFFPLRKGVQALFGPNGVGKTTVLEGIREVVAPRRNPDLDHWGRLFVQTDFDARNWMLFDDSGFLEALRANLPLETPDSGAPNQSLDLMTETDLIRELLMRRRPDQPQVFTESLADEIARQGLLAVRHIGKNETVVDICAHQREASPALREVADKHDGHSGPSWVPAVMFTKAATFRTELVAVATLWAGADVILELPYTQSFGGRATFGGIDDALRYFSTNEAFEFLRLGPHDPLSWGHTVTKRANEIYTQITGTPIGMTFEEGTLQQVLARSHPRVTATDHATDLPMPLDQLSDTQERWAQVAFYLALHEELRLQTMGIVDEDEDGDPRMGALEELNLETLGRLIAPLVVLIDEPERGFGLGIQKLVSQGLNLVAKELGIPIIVATHSAGLLDDPDTIPFKCSRRHDGSTEITEINVGDRDHLTELGVPVSEQLHLYRAVLVVEGLHEALVFDELFSSQIAANRIKVLEIRGTRQLRHLAAAGELLFTHLEDAPFILLTDNTRSTAVDEALEAGKRCENVEEGVAEIERVLDAQSDEEKVVQALLLTAAKTHQLDRFSHAFGLPQDDILHCLSAGDFGLPADWDELKEQHATARSLKNGVPNDFKTWLVETHRTDLSDQSIREVVRQMQNIPKELTDVMNACIEAAETSRP